MFLVLFVVACCSVIVLCRFLFGVCCLLVVSCSWIVAWGLLFVVVWCVGARCLISVVCCSLFVLCCSLCVACCVLCVVRCLLRFVS